MDAINFIQENNLIVIAVLLVVGKLLKGTNGVFDKYIPILLLPIGIAFVIWNQGTVDANTIMQGILCTGCAVYGNQVYKQLKKEV